MLILFDIDGTLLVTRGVSVQACLDTGKELFGSDFSHRHTRFSGNLDPLIWRGLCEENGIDEPREADFRQAFRRKLRERLDATGAATALPGSLELVERLSDIDGLSLGLLTGNYPETGRLKLDRAGFDCDLFRIGAWGSDGENRRQLLPVALDRHRTESGTELSPEEVVVIGDTPYDVDCALAGGCHALAVATGRYSTAELAESGAHHVVADLTATAELVEWIRSVPSRTNGARSPKETRGSPGGAS